MYNYFIFSIIVIRGKREDFCTKYNMKQKIVHLLGKNRPHT